MSTENNLVQVKKAAELVLKNEVCERHSLFQLQCFVLSKEPTIQGKLQQCLKEIKSRKSSLAAIELEIADQEDNLLLLDIEIENAQNTYEISKENRRELMRDILLRKIERKRKAALNHIEDLKKKEKDISEEMQFFCSAFDQLSKREPLKAWDDPEVQKQYWSEKLRFEVNMRLMLRQLPDIELLRSIMSLHDDAPIKIKCLEMLRQAPQPAIQNQRQEG